MRTFLPKGKWQKKNTQQNTVISAYGVVFYVIYVVHMHVHKIL